MIELLVVVAIIGVLSAVAIPAYQNYQDSAKLIVINASINQITSAYGACRTLNPAEVCGADVVVVDGITTAVNNTITSQPGTIIKVVTGTTIHEVCFVVYGDSDGEPTPKYSVKGKVKILPSGVAEKIPAKVVPSRLPTISCN